jgi:hypothetical protein
MAMNFPDSPTLNQTFTFAGRTWVWNGSTWANVAGSGTDAKFSDFLLMGA